MTKRAAMGLLDSVIESNNIRLSEAAIFTAADDPDRNDNILNGFRRLSKTQNERDLMPLEQQRQTEVALFLYDSNPLAKRPIDLVNGFVTGVGPSPIMIALSHMLLSKYLRGL
jgi:hypothetical protein